MKDDTFHVKNYDLLLFQKKKTMIYYFIIFNSVK